MHLVYGLSVTCICIQLYEYDLSVSEFSFQKINLDICLNADDQMNANVYTLTNRVQVCFVLIKNCIQKISFYLDNKCLCVYEFGQYIWQDDKEEEFEFHFDRVFYQRSEQANVYEFLALPIVKGRI